MLPLPLFLMRTAFCEAPWCAHFVAYRLGDVVVAILELRKDRLKQRQALFTGGLRERRERAFGGCYCLVDVRGRAKADSAVGFFGRRIDHIKRAGLDRVDPLSVNLELQLLEHEDS